MRCRTLGGGVLEFVGADFGVFSSVLSASVTYGAVSANTSAYGESCTVIVISLLCVELLQACTEAASHCHKQAR